MSTRTNNKLGSNMVDAYREAQLVRTGDFGNFEKFGAQNGGVVTINLPFF